MKIQDQLKWGEKIPKKCQKYGHNTRTCKERSQVPTKSQGTASEVPIVGFQVPTEAQGAGSQVPNVGSQVGSKSTKHQTKVYHC